MEKKKYEFYYEDVAGKVIKTVCTVIRFHSVSYDPVME